MADPNDSFDEDDDLVLAFIEQEQQTVVDTPLPSPQTRQLVEGKGFSGRSREIVKRERKRSMSVSPIGDEKSVRSMKPRVEGSSAVVATASRSAATEAKQDAKLSTAKEIDPVNTEEKAVVWPPSQTFSSDAIRNQASTSTTDRKPRVKSENNGPIVVKGSKGKSKATAINLDIKRDHDGNVTESGKKEITKHLLKTLGQKHNPITNSDLYTRTSHVVSCATGHQVAQRAGSKFSMSEKSYFHSRNSKLREQFTAQAREGLRIAEGTERAAERGGGLGAVGIGGRFGAELSRGKGELDGGAMVQQSRIFAGLTFYLNGYSGPRISDLELKRLIAIHGGNVSFLANSSCTHILITKNLSASKTQKFLDSASSIRGGKRKVVHVDWVLDSVAKRKRLDETPYNVIVNKAQPTLMSSLGVTKQNVSQDVKPSGDKPAKMISHSVEVISIDD